MKWVSLPENGPWLVPYKTRGEIALGWLLHPIRSLRERRDLRVLERLCDAACARCAAREKERTA